jgi:thymidylate synthase
MKKYFASSSFEEIYKDVLQEINVSPEFTPVTRGISCKEITNLGFELSDPRNRFVWNKDRDMNYEFAMKFFIWMVNGSTDYNYVRSSNVKADLFIDKKTTEMPTNFSTAYGPRIGRQLPAIIDELKRDKESRRAVIHILEENDQAMLGTNTKEEYPCADSITLLIRNNELNLYSRMRSNNMVLTVCYDVFNLTMLQEYVYNILKAHYPELKLGKYYHSAASAHFFDTEQVLVDKILACTEVAMPMRITKPA